MKLSIVMPVFNEAATIAEIVGRVMRLPIDKELIAVDDGSSDGTRQILESLAQPGLKVVCLETNQGKGSAIRAALPHVSGDVVAVQDADLEYDPENLPELMAPIAAGKAKVVYGTRFHPGNTIPYTRFKIAARLLSLFTNLLFPGAGVTDEATCYKLVRTDLLRSLGLECRRFEFCPEVTAKVLRLGERIVEVPIRYRPRTVDEGKKIRWMDGIEAFWTLLRYRLF
ncbi:MAG: glycosyltransferase family 2 protein [Candidatus Wallbacteria bacterium]|nr:glycosyltransferase family 2 protein [Candidatus Wallbacteria bacterium]